MNEIVYSASGVTFSYPGAKPVLDNISFEICKGESIAVLGANASGKSTLLHLLDGLYFANAGTIRAFGTLLSEECVETPPFSVQFRSQVGFLFQNSDAQLFCSTVEEELAFGPLQLGLTSHEVEQRIEDTSILFEIEHLRQRSPQTLSGGEKKRVALASIITCAPSVVLLDEPSTGLDPRTQQWLTEFLGMLHESGVTLIMCSHDLGFISEISERALILSEEHKLVYDGSVKDAMNDLELLLSANLIHAHKHMHGNTAHAHPHLHETGHGHVHGDHTTT